jgi:hypothetical protein
MTRERDELCDSQRRAIGSEVEQRAARANVPLPSGESPRHEAALWSTCVLSTSGRADAGQTGFQPDTLQRQNGPSRRAGRSEAETKGVSSSNPVSGPAFVAKRCETDLWAT